MMKAVDISEHNWGFKFESGKYKVRFGNWSDAGWHWDGDGSDLMGFLIRLKQSKVTQEFLDTMNENGISYKMIKGDVVKSAKSGNGVYEITGDNRIWHFGELEPSFDEFEESKEVVAKAYDFYEGLNFDKFYRKSGKQAKALLIKAVQQSNSFEEVFKNLEDVAQDGMQILFDYNSELESKALMKAIKAVKKGA